MPTAKRGLTILVMCLLLFWGLHTWLTNGIIGIPTSARFLRNFDDLEQVKTWTQFKEKNKNLDPSISFDRTRPSNIGSDIVLSVDVSSILEELLYPKDVAVFHVSARASRTQEEWQYPSTLILVLDQNERIRGKLFVQFLSKDCSITQTNSMLEFWFRFPHDMRGEPYSVVIEQFGVYGVESGTGSSFPQQFEAYDSLYGQIPYWNPNDSTERPFRFLAYARTSGRSPSTSIFDWLDLAVKASAFSSSAIVGFLVRFSKELWEYHNKHKELFIYETLCFLTLVLFLIFLWSVVYGRF